MKFSLLGLATWVAARLVLLVLFSANTVAQESPFGNHFDVYEFSDRADQARDGGYSEQAVELYRNAAERGYAYAMFYLGEMLYLGEGTPQDYPEAAKWFQLAADRHFANAAAYLGFMNEQGLGMPSNFLFAYVWYDIAARQGYLSAATNRDQLVQNLTKAQLSEARGWVTKWEAAHPIPCAGRLPCPDY